MLRKRCLEAERREAIFENRLLASAVTCIAESQTRSKRVLETLHLHVWSPMVSLR